MAKPADWDSLPTEHPLAPPPPVATVPGTTREEREALRANVEPYAGAAYEIVPMRASFVLALLAERDALERERDAADAALREAVATNEELRARVDAYENDGLRFHRTCDANALKTSRLLDAARGQRDQAVGLLQIATDGGMTDYTDAPNEPICGFCGYEVAACEARDWSEGGITDCPGIEARAFLASLSPVEPAATPGEPAMKPETKGTA
jgi:hypothetical protein